MSKSQITLRAATRNDVESIAQIHYESWRVAYPGLLPNELLESVSIEDRRALWSQRLATTQTEMFLVAETNSVVVAFASFGPSRDGHEFEEADLGSDEENAEVYVIYAQRTSWRTGVGTELMHAIIDRCQLDGYRSIVVWVLESNIRARKFFEAVAMKLDRQEVRVRDKYMLSGVRYSLNLSC